MGVRRLPSWPALVMLAGAILCFGVACSLFHYDRQKAIDQLAAARNVHMHALVAYNARCRPVPASGYQGCMDYYHALVADEKAIAAALAAVGAGTADLQMRDVQRANKALLRFDR